MARPQQISTETITQALAAHPEVTVAEVAETLGIGQSTAAKHLATLQAAGAARREPGGRRVAGGWRTDGAPRCPRPMKRLTTVPTTPHPTVPSARPTGSPVAS